MTLKQISLAATRFERVAQKTRKREFLDEMSLVVPWSELVGLIQPYARSGRVSRPPFAVVASMKADIGVDADSGLVHTVIGTAGNVNDVTHQEHGLLHGDEAVVFADAGYQGAAKRPEATRVDWHVAMRPGRRRALDRQTLLGALLNRAEKLKASVRAKVEHPF